MCELFSIFIDYYSACLGLSVCMPISVSVSIFLSFLVHYTYRFGTQKRYTRADSHVYCSIFSLTKMSDLYNIHVISYILSIYTYIQTQPYMYLYFVFIHYIE